MNTVRGVFWWLTRARRFSFGAEIRSRLRRARRTIRTGTAADEGEALTSSAARGRGGRLRLAFVGDQIDRDGAR